MNDKSKYIKHGRRFYFIKSRPFPRNKDQEYSDYVKYPPAGVSREEWSKQLARELGI